MLEQVTVVSSKVAAAEVALSESALPELRAAVAALGGRAVDTAAAAEWMPAVGIDEEAGGVRERLQKAAVEAAVKAVARCVLNRPLFRPIDALIFHWPRRKG